MAKHVTIIGSGLAGVTAALAAKERGAQVTVISGPPGATAVASGAWDIAEPVGDLASYTWDNYPDASTCIEQIVRAYPQHPYSVMSEGDSRAKLWPVIKKAFKVLFECMPYRPHVEFEKQQVMMTPLGTVKFSAIADPAQARGDLRQSSRGRLLLLGIPGLTLSPLALMERVFQTVQKRAGTNHRSDVVTDRLEIEGIPQHSLSPFALAQRFEEEASLAACIKAIREGVRRHKADWVMLPPVMGIENSGVILERLRTECGVICAETLATAPSVPGLRRHRALEHVLHRSGVGIVQDKIIGYRGDAHRVTQLILANQGEEAPLEVDQLVLCSGRFLSGGLSSNGEMHEAIFSLPVFAGGREIGSTFMGKLVRREYFSDHRIFSAGVKFGSTLQPLNRWDEAPFENLRVAGSLLGGYNASAGGAGSGVAAVSGWIAGDLAAS